MSGLKELCGCACGFAESVIKSAAPLGDAVETSAFAAQAAATQLLLAIAPSPEEIKQAEMVKKLLASKGE